MTPFERGYHDFLHGCALEDNPFIHDEDTEPYSRKRWTEGWNKAKGDRK